jgi:uncharacterized protein
MRKTLLVLAFLAIFLGVFLLAQLLAPVETITIPLEEVMAPVVNASQRVMLIPAVDPEGRGIITRLVVEARPGYGRTLVNIDQLLFWVDTQHSIRIAKNLAEELTGMDLSNLDLIYTIETNASIIGGESAGAAITVATIALLENKTLRSDVMMTGTIDERGNIGKVGAILPKAIVARDAGMSLFLVPETQGTQVYYEPVERCKRIGPMTFCTTTYEARRIDIGEEVGIEVEEVMTIQDALDRFLV